MGRPRRLRQQAVAPPASRLIALPPAWALTLPLAFTLLLVLLGLLPDITSYPFVPATQFAAPDLPLDFTPFLHVRHESLVLQEVNEIGYSSVQLTGRRGEQTTCLVEDISWRVADLVLIANCDSNEIA